MKNKFILVTKRLAALALAGAMALAPATKALADSSSGHSVNSGYSVSISHGSGSSLGYSLSVSDGKKCLWRVIADSPNGHDTMHAVFVDYKRRPALNSKNKVVAAMDNLAVNVTANGKNSKTAFKQSAADVYGSFDLIRGKAATKSTKFSVRVRLLDKDGKVLESRKFAVNIPNKSFVTFKGEWDGKSGQIFVSNGKKTVCVSYPKAGQKLQFTLYATGAKNNTSARTYTLSRILTGKKSSTDYISYTKDGINHG